MLTAPFLGALILYRPGYIKIILSCVVAALAAYSVYVTYSRANYPATFSAILVFVLGAWLVSPWRILHQPRFVVAGIVALTLCAGAAYHLLVGTTISKRFAQTMEDMQTRINHWSHAVRIVLAEPSGK
jgi:1,2-phenylacetyl-CoA epoxidase catalytic subunit